MAREAMLVITFFEDYDFLRCLDILCNKKWTIFNLRDNVELLPIGDNGDYEWEEKSISWDETVRIIRTKCELKETVGINLFSVNEIQGVSMLMSNPKEIIFSFDINRKSIDNDRESLTDFSWYFSNIIIELFKNDSMLFAYRFEDYYD